MVKANIKGIEKECLFSHLFFFTKSKASRLYKKILKEHEESSSHLFRFPLYPMTRK